MITTDCPFCAGEAHVEPNLDALICQGCGMTVEIAPEPAVSLEAAA